MTYDHNFFTPDTVDEQVDQLSQHSMRDYLPRNERTGEASQAGASLIGDLKAYYQVEQQEDIASLERARKRVSVRLPRDREHSQSTTKPLSTPIPRVPQERIPMMRNHVSDVSRGGNFSRRMSLLGAVLVAALLVGSLAAIFNLSRHLSTTGVPVVQATHAPAATSTPAPAPVPGKTLYTTPANQWGFDSLSWSPNSKRVASATGSVQFWDATTGDHLVTVQLPGGANEWANGLDWSPNSGDVAVATNQHLLIIDGQTGKVISSHAANVQTASNATSSGQTFLSSLFPASGGSGFRATAWSPDGHLMASALSFGPYGEVQVWNPQTGASDFTLKVGSSYCIGALAWSSTNITASAG